MKKVVAILFGLFVLGALGVGIAVFVFLPKYVRAQIIEQAKRRGVELEPGEVSFGIGWVQVKDSNLSLVGLPSVRAKVGIIDVELARFTPQRFKLSDVKVEARTSARGVSRAAIQHAIGPPSDSPSTTMSSGRSPCASTSQRQLASASRYVPSSVGFPVLFP